MINFTRHIRIQYPSMSLLPCWHETLERAQLIASSLRCVLLNSYWVPLSSKNDIVHDRKETTIPTEVLATELARSSYNTSAVGE